MCPHTPSGDRGLAPGPADEVMVMKQGKWTYPFSQWTMVTAQLMTWPQLHFPPTPIFMCGSPTTSSSPNPRTQLAGEGL